MKRSGHTVLWLVVIAAQLGALALLAWHFRDRTLTFYTDDDTIRQSLHDARPRDVLWRPPTILPETINSATDEYEASVSRDGLTLLFVRGTAGGEADLYTCVRTPSGWSEPQPLAEVNTDADELGPELTPDGQTLYFYSDRTGGLGGYDIWRADRTADDRWSDPTNLGAGINSASNDYGPCVAPDGTQLLFASNRLPSAASDAAADSTSQPPSQSYNIYASSLVHGEPADAMAVESLNSPSNEGSPEFSPVGDFIYICSDREGGEGGYDLYRARRSDAGFTALLNLGAPVNTSSNELDPALSLEGFGLYFSSDRPAMTAPAETAPDELTDAVGDYDLFFTTSREVTTGTEVVAASIDWASLLAAIAPFLLWLLLALLLALLLLRFMKSDRFSTLGLLARCLLASALVHLLIVVLLTFWGVQSSLNDWLKDGQGQRVILVSASMDTGIASQIRGEITARLDVAAEAASSEQRTSEATPSESQQATVEVARAEMETPTPINDMQADVPDGRNVEAQPVEAAEATEDASTTEVAVPAPAQPSASRAEATMAVAAEQPAAQRVEHTADDSSTQTDAVAMPMQPTPMAVAEAMVAADAAPAQPTESPRPTTQDMPAVQQPAASAALPSMELVRQRTAEAAHATGEAMPTAQRIETEHSQAAPAAPMAEQSPRAATLSATPVVQVDRGQLATSGDQPRPAESVDAELAIVVPGDTSVETPTDQQVIGDAAPPPPLVVIADSSAGQASIAAQTSDANTSTVVESPTATSIESQQTLAKPRSSDAPAVQHAELVDAASPAGNTREESATTAELPEQRAEATTERATESTIGEIGTAATGLIASPASTPDVSTDSVQVATGASATTPVELIRPTASDVAIAGAAPTIDAEVANSVPTLPDLPNANIPSAVVNASKEPQAEPTSDLMAAVSPARRADSRPGAGTSDTPPTLETSLPAARQGEADTLLLATATTRSDAPTDAAASIEIRGNETRSVDDAPAFDLAMELETDHAAEPSEGRTVALATPEATIGPAASPATTDFSSRSMPVDVPSSPDDAASSPSLIGDPTAAETALPALAMAFDESAPTVRDDNPMPLGLPALDEAGDPTRPQADATPSQPTPAVAVAQARGARANPSVENAFTDDRPALNSPATELPAMHVESSTLVQIPATELTIAPLPDDVTALDLTGPSLSNEMLSLDLPSAEAPKPAMYPQRAEEQREAVVQTMGGSPETERAVKLALAWLARHQSDDGRWDGRNFDDGCGQCSGSTRVTVDIALTGLSVLCFMAADHTHTKAGPYQETVAKALDWLVSIQGPESGELMFEESMYSHGIASIALAEAYGMSRDERLRGPAERAIRFIERAPNREVGGWRYSPGQLGDTSVMGWQIMALASARRAGIEVADASMQVGADWLRLVEDENRAGLYGYQPDRRWSPTMTAEGMFVQQLLGSPRDSAAMRNGATEILNNLPDWSSETNTYYWYYATLAMYQHQGEAWSRWNEVIKNELLEHQHTRGNRAGSWDPQGKWAHVGGRVYQTALCTLTLEVYYRYLPLYLQPDREPDRRQPGR